MFIVVQFSLKAIASTIRTIANGNLTSGIIWQGGVAPSSIMLNTANIILVHHDVTFPNSNYSTSGTDIIEPSAVSPATTTIAALRFTSGFNVENFSTGKWYIINGSFIQCKVLTNALKFIFFKV